MQVQLRATVGRPIRSKRPDGMRDLTPCTPLRWGAGAWGSGLRLEPEAQALPNARCVPAATAGLGRDAGHSPVLRHGQQLLALPPVPRSGAGGGRAAPAFSRRASGGAGCLRTVRRSARRGGPRGSDWPQGMDDFDQPASPVCYCCNLHSARRDQRFHHGPIALLASPIETRSLNEIVNLLRNGAGGHR